jgi:diguanylate cyclase (GGDEF)-like protein
MESASSPALVPPLLDAALLAAAIRLAAAEAAGSSPPAKAIDSAVGMLHYAAPSILPSVFVLEHGRLWLVAQRGYAVVPDGIAVERGVMGRAVRVRRAQLASDVLSDPDYVAALPGVSSELAVPLRAGRMVVGVLNLESESVLPDGAAEIVKPLASALTPLAEALRASRTLDLPALARLFVHLGSLRDAGEIAALAATSLPRVLPLEWTQVWLWDEIGLSVDVAFWRSDASSRAPLTADELADARTLVDPSVVCQLLETSRPGNESGRPGPVVWLPLRANGKELGAVVGGSISTTRVDPAELDTAAVLAAHVAASLDAALALGRERQSAVTDPLTGVLNRRGLEEHLESELAAAQERRVPVSVIVIDCDDFKDINDRAGHEFGDALLREVAHVLVRSLPEGARAARLGGDEFVVTLPGAGADVAEALGARIRDVLAEGLTDAGFPLRISAGVSTYPFDGAGPTALLRAADQALYAAKDAGKDRVASFRDLVRQHPAQARPGAASPADERRRASRSGGSILSDAMAAAEAIEAEDTVDAVCNRLCKALVFVVGATGCSASRVVGDFLVDATGHALREVSLGDEAAYRISDFPLTAEALCAGRPQAISFLDAEIDPSEAFILRELNMNALLMLPLRVRGRPWGLVELYEMRLRRFSEDDVAIAQFLTSQAERRLDSLGPSDAPSRRPPVYRLPPGGGVEPGAPRTR